MSVKAWAILLVLAAAVIVLFVALTPAESPVDACMDKAELSTQGISQAEWSEKYDRALAACEARS
jgi:hypothetical protein